jgi:glycosyltransferase involved in cell wall biosynthesis
MDKINSQKKWVLDKLAGFSNISFKGRLTKKELAKEMLSSSLCLYPNNFWETFCLTALETQASAVPMVTTDRGALATTLTHDGNVLIKYDVNTPQYRKAFIDSTCDLLNNREKRKSYAQICREYAMQSKLDWKDIGESWQQMIWGLY